MDESFLKGISDLDAKPPAFETLEWGHWRYNPAAFILEYTGEALPGYWIALDSCTDSSEILDWIAQVAKKDPPRGDVDDLARALNALFDLQRNVCPWGKGRTIDPRATVAHKLAEGVRTV